MARQIQERFEVLGRAGEGTYGVVYKAVSRRDPSVLVAIKEMRHDEQEEGVPSSALREISLLLELEHPNVVRLYEVANDHKQHRMFLIFEFLDVDLYRLMQANPAVFRSDSRLVEYYMYQLLQGLDYLHRRSVAVTRRGMTIFGDVNVFAATSANQGKLPAATSSYHRQLCTLGILEVHRFIMQLITQHIRHKSSVDSHKILHRDLKPQNLLITRHGNVLKLADFGLARAMGLPVRALSPEVVTIWYRAPELLLGQKEYTAAVDMWSAGCILAEMTAVRPLFPGMRDIDQLNRIFTVLGTPTEHNWPGYHKLNGARAAMQLPFHPGQDLAALLPNMPLEGLDLLRHMLVLDPAHRIDCRSALKHPYFKDIGDILQDPPRLG